MHKSIYFKSTTGEESVDKKTLKSLQGLKLDSVFIDASVATADQIKAIREVFKETLIYVVVSVFKDANLVAKFPDAHPVEVDDKDTAGWLCPTHEQVVKEKLGQIQSLTNLVQLQEDSGNTAITGISGIWLNEINYPTHWSTPNPELLDTCYCERCMTEFTHRVGEEIQGVGGEGTDLQNTALHIDGSYYHEWLEFKTSNITSFVRQAKKLVKDKGLTFGALVVPWDDSQHQAAIKRVLGQDFGMLAEETDYLNPMLFFKSCDKSLEWISNRVDYFWETGASFFPFIEGTNDSNQMQTALEYASKSPSKGVCVLFETTEGTQNAVDIATIKKFFS